MTLHFDRKRTVVLGVGLALTGVLTFAAGMVTGIVLWTPTREEIAILNSASKAKTPAAAPKLPAVPTLALLPGAVKAEGAAASAPTPAPAAQAAPPPAPASSEPPAAPPASATPAPAASTSLAESAPAPAPIQSAGAQDAFSLQLGSFRDAKNAKQLQNDLKERGYAASIFTAMDSEQREWHVVRIGGFKTLSSAAQAAATFNSKERIQALIRRSDAL
jgi:cell division septation protein DedD